MLAGQLLKQLASFLSRQDVDQRALRQARLRAPARAPLVAELEQNEQIREVVARPRVQTTVLRALLDRRDERPETARNDAAVVALNQLSQKPPKEHRLLRHDVQPLARHELLLPEEPGALRDAPEAAVRVLHEDG